MTEQEWLECTVPTPMLTFLQGNVSERRLRLFACACGRRILWASILPSDIEVVAVAEWFADGECTEEEMLKSYQAAHDAAIRHGYTADPLPCTADRSAAHAAKFTSSFAAGFGVEDYEGDNPTCQASWAEALRRAMIEDAAEHAVMLREIIGNPFRPIAIDPRWLTSTVVDLAQTIYNDRAFERMAILSDALMDSRCDCQEILNHCRQPIHVRGCWVLDLILGKS